MNTRVILAPCGRHSYDPRKLDVPVFLGHVREQLEDILIAHQTNTGPRLELLGVKHFPSHDSAIKRAVLPSTGRSAVQEWYRQ